MDLSIQQEVFYSVNIMRNVESFCGWFVLPCFERLKVKSEIEFKYNGLIKWEQNAESSANVKWNKILKITNKIPKIEIK